VQRAVIVDRDPMLLAWLADELGRHGYAVETLDSTLGLTPDLLAMSEPDLLVFDAELPGVDRVALLVIARALKSLRKVHIVVSSEGDVRAIQALAPIDQAVQRSELQRRGALSLGLRLEAEAAFDLRALLDRVLEHRSAGAETTLAVGVDLFSKSNLFVAPGSSAVVGVFFATQVLPPVGQRMKVELEVLKKKTLTLQGEVAWQRPHSSFGGRMATGIGIRFLEATEEDRAVLNSFLELREPFVGAA
jgi:CheY-like chemotaxis protein